MPPGLSKRSKTSRFPVARIKKIMQMDEEVGKLASATPVMISKSLECFLQLLVDEATKEARAKGSKKIAAHHVKHAVNSNPNLDFLLLTVSKIPEPSAAETGAVGGNGEGGSGSASHGNGNGNGAGPSRARKPTSSTNADGTPVARGRKRKAAPAGTDETASPRGGASGGASGSPAAGAMFPGGTAGGGVGGAGPSVPPAFARSPAGAGRSTSYGSSSKVKLEDTKDTKDQKPEQEWESINPTPRSMINLLNPTPGDGGGGPRFPGMGMGSGVALGVGSESGGGGGVKEEPDEYVHDRKPDIRGQGGDADDAERDQRDQPAPAPAPAVAVANESKGMFDDYDDEDDY